jgi:hypothetical protein
MKTLHTILAAIVATSAFIRPAAADERDRHRGFERPPRHEVWRGDIRHFRDHDFDRWRGGRWYHGRHLGRVGWWWIVGGIWYFYTTPVYPYPNPYLPPVVVVPPAPAPAPAPAPVPEPPAQPQYWYYCPNPPGYYPYVAQCATNWQQVPAAPQAIAPR